MDNSNLFGGHPGPSGDKQDVKKLKESRDLPGNSTTWPPYDKPAKALPELPRRSPRPVSPPALPPRDLTGDSNTDP